MHIIDEHYHVYNRGAHKAPIFLDKSDYERFVALLYVANRNDRLKSKWFRNPWQTKTDSRLVDIFSYCLMPNHFHLGLLEKSEGGIEVFLHKICTSYAMYYNRKYDHSGTIFQGPYKHKHVDSDEYLRYLIQYIHLNPFGIEEPDMMKSAKIEYLEEATLYSKTYDYSSFKDYLGEIRPQNAVLSRGLTSR